MSQEFSDLKATIAALLANSQWSAKDPLGFAISVKDYQTAGGVKQVQATLLQLKDGDAVALLRAEERSEGGNTLSSIWYSIAPGLSRGDLAQLLQRFSAEVDETLGQTYSATPARPENDEEKSDD